MREVSIRVPVTCPECGAESLSEFIVAGVVDSLFTESPVELYSTCHRVHWAASPSEREQIREYLASIALDRPS